jgi:hypothetical protein
MREVTSSWQALGLLIMLTVTSVLLPGCETSQINSTDNTDTPDVPTGDGLIYFPLGVGKIAGPMSSLSLFPAIVMCLSQMVSQPSALSVR